MQAVVISLLPVVLVKAASMLQCFFCETKNMQKKKKKKVLEETDSQMHFENTSFT